MKNIISFISLFVFSSTAFGHSPFELAYDIHKGGSCWELKIHLTPVTAIAILEAYYPELIKEDVVNLQKHGIEVAQYFHEHIKIVIDNKKDIILQLKQYNLLQHDAEIVFLLVGVPTTQNSWTVEITAFLDIYRRAKNIVNIHIGGDVHKALLKAEHTSYSLDLNDETSISKAFMNQHPSNYCYVLPILLFCCVLVIYKFYN